MADAPQKPALQQLMDNPWLLLVLGVVVPILSYTVWGWLELSTMAPARLP
jgi:hypothetical protein